jgi:hypothetical protein
MGKDYPQRTKQEMTMRDDPLPIQFADLITRVHYVRKRGKNEWSSSCPECGGDMHADGRTFPDRFRMWPVSKGGFPLGWCRHCGYTWTPQKERKPSAEEIEAWRKAQIEIEEQRKREAERALELLQSQKLWERFHENATRESRQLCRAWGIDEKWQDYLKIGYLPDYTVYAGEASYKSPAVTFPVWWAGHQVQNIKIRTIEPRDDSDRYRNWYKTGEQNLYMPLHEEFFGGGVILVEGEKKAIVTEANNPTDYRVIGYQSKRPDPDLFDAIRDCEPVCIIPDPDAFAKDKDGSRGVDYLTGIVGKERARVVQTPVKVDDGILQHDLDLAKYIRMARKAK